MAKRKSPTSFRSMIIFSLVATAFVVAIAWGSFDDLARVAIVGGLTFVVVLVGLVVLNRFSKEDDSEPGQPRLK